MCTDHLSCTKCNMLIQHRVSRRMVYDGCDKLPRDLNQYMCCHVGCRYSDVIVGDKLDSGKIALSHGVHGRVEGHHVMEDRTKRAIALIHRIYIKQSMCTVCGQVVRLRLACVRPTALVLEDIIVFTTPFTQVVIPLRWSVKSRTVIVRVNMHCEPHPNRHIIRLPTLGCSRRVYIPNNKHVRELCSRHRQHYEYPLRVFTRVCPSCERHHDTRVLTRTMLCPPNATDVPSKTSRWMLPPGDMMDTLSEGDPMQVVYYIQPPENHDGSAQLVGINGSRMQNPTLFRLEHPVKATCELCKITDDSSEQVTCCRVCQCVTTDALVNGYCDRCNAVFAPPAFEKASILYEGVVPDPVLLRLLHARAELEVCALDATWTPPESLYKPCVCSVCEADTTRRWCFQLSKRVYVCIRCARKCEHCNDVVSIKSPFRKCYTCRNARQQYQQASLLDVDAIHCRTTTAYV